VDQRLDAKTMGDIDENVWATRRAFAHVYLSGRLAHDERNRPGRYTSVSLETTEIELFSDACRWRDLGV